MASSCPILPEDPIFLDDVLIPDLYAKIGRDFPHRIFARILTEDGGHNLLLEDVTWGKLLHDSVVAANSLLGFGIPKRSGNAPQMVLAILAMSSYRYYTYLVAAWLNDWTPLLLSPRNSVPAIQHLVSSVKAQGILLDETTINVEPELRQLIPDIAVMKMQKLPVDPPNGYASGLSDVLSRQPPSNHKVDEVAVYMHTSGSQGHPKPVPTTHRQFTTGIKSRSAKRYTGSPVYAPLPLFHGMGMYAFTRWPIGSGVIPTFVAIQRPITGADMTRHLEHLTRAIAFLPPAILEEIVDAGENEIKSLTSVQHIFYGGAPLKESTGNILVSRGIPIANAFGMSEISLISVLGPPSEDLLSDWSYIRFREDLYNLHFLPTESSTAYELVVGPGLMHPAVINHELGFSTNDLWVPHPKIKCLWKHMGRKDGVTVLSTGEKTDNGQLVSLLTQDPRIAHAVVFGSGKPFNGVIISPSPKAETISSSEFEPDAFRESVWETFLTVNGIIPTHSRLIRQMVLVEKPSKPFVVTDKGTVRSRETLALYEPEISVAYSIFDTRTKDMETPPAKFDHVEVKSKVRDIVQKVCGRAMTDHSDIFDAGADSLHVLQIRAELLPLIKAVKSDFIVPLNMVYTQPTIDKMVSFIINGVRGPSPEASFKNAKETRVEDCIRRFSVATPRKIAKSSDGMVVLLTGSTGSLGCHILDHLLSRNDIRHVHCLVRGQASVDRFKSAFRDRSIPIERLEQHQMKVVIHFADFSKPDLALSPVTLEMIRKEITHIFHLAWELNFNWPLERFEKTHVAGVRHLIDLACSSARPSPPKLVFSSSIGAVGNPDVSHQVLEQAFDDPKMSMDSGYGEAKYVAERLIDSASRRQDFPATIIRCGQLSGSTVNGAWARTEFIPVLFKSSLFLGLFPETMPPVRWLPVDVAARCFSDLALDESTGVKYYHIENTESTPWSEVTSLFLAVAGGTVNVVPTEEWLTAIERAGTTPDHTLASEIPAAFLLDFYSRLTAASDTWCTLDTSSASQITPDVRRGKITSELMDKYVSWVKNN